MLTRPVKDVKQFRVGFQAPEGHHVPLSYEAAAVSGFLNASTDP